MSSAELSVAGAAPASLAARERFRASGRAVARQPERLDAHMERLSLSLGMPGAEPAQGALADLFLACAQARASDRRAAVEAVRERLNPVDVRRFEAHIDGPAFPACSRMATRWSVLASASLDIPRRALRCSTDDSRQLADAALRAWRDGDDAAQEEFMDHCLVCRDTFAFMLARRVILREAGVLPAPWASVFAALQKTVAAS